MRAQLSTLTRRAAVATALIGALAVAACNQAGGKAEGDMAIGAGEDAKVTVVEYASVACHACAGWNDQVWPEFKAKYVDTNKVRYVFREMITGNPDVALRDWARSRWVSMSSTASWRARRSGPPASRRAPRCCASPTRWA